MESVDDTARCPLKGRTGTAIPGVAPTARLGHQSVPYHSRPRSPRCRTVDLQPVTPQVETRLLTKPPPASQTAHSRRELVFSRPPGYLYKKIHSHCRLLCILCLDHPVYLLALRAPCGATDQAWHQMLDYTFLDLLQHEFSCRAVLLARRGSVSPQLEPLLALAAAVFFDGICSSVTFCSLSGTTVHARKVQSFVDDQCSTYGSGASAAVWWQGRTATGHRSGNTPCPTAVNRDRTDAVTDMPIRNNPQLGRQRLRVHGNFRRHPSLFIVFVRFFSVTISRGHENTESTLLNVLHAVMP